MARPKGTPKKKPVIDDRFQPQEVKTPFCLNCGTNGKVNSFYISNNATHINNSCRLPYCKECLETFYQEYYKKTGRSDLAIFYLCRKCDVFFSTKVFEGAESASLKMNQPIVSCYFRMLNSIKDNAGFKDNFNDSANFLDLEILEDKYRTGKLEIGSGDNQTVNVAPDMWTEEDEVSRTDCINLLGYDPFFDNDNKEKKFLYNTLIGFLDDATLKDSFKLPIVIELVKSLGQVERLNKTFNTMMASAENIEENASKISTLIGSKDKLYRSILAIAKDNGISVVNSGDKSQGAGTLSSMVKELNDIGLREAKINLFDARTLGGIKQANDLSNKSIFDQLALTDSEWADMVKELREIRVDLEEKVLKLKEDLRLEKVKNDDLTNIQNQMQEYIDKLEEKYNKLNNSKYRQVDN